MKKMNNKKYRSVFLLMLFPLILLCGCGADQDEVAMTLLEAETRSVEYEEMTSMLPLEKEAMLEPARIYVYICGAVELPGVYCLKEGSRLYEAVELAGGMTSDADKKLSQYGKADCGWGADCNFDPGGGCLAKRSGCL